LFIHWILNAWREPLDFELPTECGQWNRWIDTSLESPEDIVTWEDVRPVLDPYYRAAPHSVVVLFSSTAASSPLVKPAAPSD
jgi:glycogen operon protein